METSIDICEEMDRRIMITENVFSFWGSWLKVDKFTYERKEPILTGFPQIRESPLGWAPGTITI